MYYPIIASDSNEPSLSSLPRDIVWNCLLRVPRSNHLNISCVSKTLRSLVLSPEFRSLLPKDSIYVSFLAPRTAMSTNCHWFTLRRLPIENTKKIQYRLFAVPIPFPCDAGLFRSYYPTSVVVGPEIYFVGGPYFLNRSSDLWIFDTRSGKLTQGPSMKVARTGDYLVGVVDGKIYVIGGACKDEEEIQVEVFDPISRSWSFLGEEKMRSCISRQFAVSMNRKVYMVGYSACISAYNPNLSEGRRILEMIPKSKKRTRDEMLSCATSDGVVCVCVVENVMYACFAWSGLKWFDTKLKVWKKLVKVDGKPVYAFSVSAMTEYNGMLAVLWPQRKFDSEEKKDVICGFISLYKVGERICGKIEWSGIVATVPSDFRSLRCLVVSDHR
ncbi:unnamed protein product [Arabis nemorensis]|uniref:Uncharacterized protein n=1 Tax=Arabis nemorensis TaxID=586526 RepID=A0A565AW01_9BRAS|nr:unnamed protein product [Arabis nemorensis]